MFSLFHPTRRDVRITRVHIAHKGVLNVKKVLIGGILFAALMVIGLAAGIDGRWEGTFSSPNGDMDLVFNFKTDGQNLTGTVDSQMGEMPISNGKIDGDEFSFDVDAMGEAITHKGTVNGDSIHMKVSSSFGEWELDLNRAKQ